MIIQAPSLPAKPNVGLAKLPSFITVLRVMKKLLALLAVILLSANAFAGSFPDITLPDLKAAIAAKKVTLLDVNGPVTYANGHIPGAIDYTAHTADLASVLPSDKSSLIVAYCGNEHCGAYARAAEAAQKLGYTNVQHFKPGIAGWKAAGEPTAK
jgi:rhodanese-related sulfurtransferase